MKTNRYGGGSPSPAPEIRLLRRLLSFGRAVFGETEFLSKILWTVTTARLTILKIQTGMVCPFFAFYETVYYVSDKLVTFKSEFDDQNLRVMLIPSWWKENNLVAGLANSKYTDFSYVKLNRSVSELTLDVYTANDILIMSYLLNPSSFSKNWEIPTGEKISLDSFYLHYKGTEQLKKEEVSAPLITAVRIPEEVYNTMYPDYELHIDVIADAIEKYGDAVDNRNFN